jgi:putative ABC transport system permease protein
MNDLRFALRQLLKSPGFTAIAVVTLALGIGACAAIFSVVNGVLLHPLPFAEPDRLVVLNESQPPELAISVVRPATFPHWKRQQTSFEGIAVVRDGSYNLTGRGEPVRAYTGKVTANAFPMLRVQPALGRGFTAEEEVPGKGDVVILSHGFWQRQFGGQPEVLAQTVQLDGVPFRIVGVMPKGFQVDGNFDLYIPHGYEVFRDDEGDNRTIFSFARLRPGVTLEQARSELTLIQTRLAKDDDFFHNSRPLVRPMIDSQVGQVRRPLWALLGAVGFLLLIACANVANLLLARATARAREIAVRAALGASRARLVRQLLAESVCLAALGALLGVLAAQWGLSALLALAPDTLPRAQEIAIDGRVLSFTCALALLTGIGFGLVPAFQATGADLNDTLKEGGRGTAPGHHRMRGALVVAEVAVALVLLAGAGLLVRSFARLQAVDRGFRPEHAVAVVVNLPQSTKYASPAQQAAFAGQVVQRLAALPGVTAAGAVQDLPFPGGLFAFCLIVEGRPTPPGCEVTKMYAVSPGYQAAMGLRLLRGRFLGPGEVANAPEVCVVNETLARKHFPGQDPIGKRIGSQGREEKKGLIVGVVADVRDEGLAGAVHPQAYVAFAQFPSHSQTFVVRSAGAGPGDAALRGAIQAVDGQQPIASIRPLSAMVAGSIARERFAMSLFAVFSGLALLLAAIGIYGVMAYSVAQRRAEIGIRMALGAQSADVVGLVLRQGSRLVVLGLAVGLAGALLLTRLLGTMLFGISPHDPVTFAAIAVLLAGVAAVACLVPARRATRVDPMTALRSE